MCKRAVLGLLLASLTLAACGGGGGEGSSGVSGLTITPTVTRLAPGGFQIFTAVLNGGARAINWSVVEPEGGTIDDQGRYQAPLRSGTFNVKATLESDRNKSATTTVVVDSGFTIVATVPATLGTGRTLNVDARVVGGSNTAVTYTATGGTISPTGVFTAPGTPGTATITATSVADPGKSRTFTLAIVPAIEIVAPATGLLSLPRARTTFSAKVDGAASPAVDWTASTGTIDGNGRFVAGETAGSVTITATRRDDPTRSASVVLDVAENVDALVQVEGKGEILLSLRPDQAPGHCANLVSLINEGFYDGIIFHRYEPNFVIQGGDPLTKTLPLSDPSIGTGGPGYSIPFEENPLNNVRGSLAMARAQSRDSGGSQVYINLVDNNSLDREYVVFGSVRSGLDIVDSLRRGDKITRIRVQRP